MIKVVDFTVYELLGYLFPGAVACCGGLLVAGMFHADWLTVAYWQAFAWGWIFAPVSGSYVVGHLLQAGGNYLFDADDSEQRSAAFTRVLSGATLGDLQRLLSIPMAFLPRLAPGDEIAADAARSQLLTFCSAGLEGLNQTRTIDVYQYREGFYRAGSIATSVIALGFVGQCANGWSHSSAGGLEWTIVGLSAIVVIGVLFCWNFDWPRPQLRRFAAALVVWTALSTFTASIPLWLSVEAPATAIGPGGMAVFLVACAATSVAFLFRYRRFVLRRYESILAQAIVSAMRQQSLANSQANAAE